MDPWQAGLNHLLLLSACLFFWTGSGNIQLGRTYRDLPDHMEGRSIMPLLNDPEQPWKKAAFSQYPRGRVMGYSMRTERSRYTEWQNRQSGNVMARELYDHEKDPCENVNVVDELEYAPDVKRLSEIPEKGWRAVVP